MREGFGHANSEKDVGRAVAAVRRRSAVVVAGGTEAAITPMGVGGFAAMRALSTRNDDPEKASRPWDSGRDGFVIGEGAGILVLEEYEHAKARGAKIYTIALGSGADGDTLAAMSAGGKDNAPNDEWAIVGPLIPGAKRGGNKRTVVEREIVNGLM